MSKTHLELTHKQIKIIFRIIAALSLTIIIPAMISIQLGEITPIVIGSSMLIAAGTIACILWIQNKRRKRLRKCQQM